MVLIVCIDGWFRFDCYVFVDGIENYVILYVGRDTLVALRGYISIVYC